MEVLKGYIAGIVYANEDNGYKVCRFRVDDTEEFIVGNMPGVGEGEMLEVSGEWTIHKIYDKQFKVTTFKSITPEDDESMIRYLGSGIIKGIGPTLAKRIVDAFGKDAFDVIETTPERLAQVKGITMQKAREIGIIMREKRGFRDACMFLQKYGVGNAMALKIYGFYQDRIYRVIEENPYRLAEDIDGIGFKTADDIAHRAGVMPDSDYRIRSGIQYTLSLATGQGHMYLPKNELAERSANILEVSSEAVEPQIMNLIVERRLISKSPKTEGGQASIYLPANYNSEKASAAMLRGIEESAFDEKEDETVIMKRIDTVCKNAEIVPDEVQRHAVFTSVQHGISIITGGPGTGKTTIINILINYFASEKLDIALAAPTGRAAKRMTEATGYEAKTIHRLLEINGALDEDVKGARFERNELNPLEIDVVIVDEMSMVDIFLFQALLKAIPAGAKLIMVGDADQLPSVGPGQVLRDLIASKCFPVTKLEHIYRQEGGGDIVTNAHKIHKGEPVVTDNKSSDFFMLKRDDSARILANTVELMTQMLPGYVDATPFDIQVLTPSRKGTLGVEAMNRYLQEHLNPPAPNKHEHMFGETLFREGDKVMQIRNNYKAEWEIVGKYNIPIDAGLGVFNGDMGRVVSISDPAGEMTVEFDDNRRVNYPYSDLDELELAYAITVHKSQGSEYAAVVMPLMMGPRQLMNRNLLYTGVTRARKCLVILGDEETLNFMISNNEENLRYSGFLDRILEVYAM